MILAGGGGHTGFGYALAQRLQNKALMTFMIPEEDNLSRKRLSQFGKVVGLTKPRGAKTATSLFVSNMIKAFWASTRKVKSEFDVVVSTGSNFCILPALVASLKRIPLINIESEGRFIRASKTACFLQSFSTVTVLQWHEQKSFLNGTVVGPLFPKPEIAPWNGGYILVTAGTLGYKRLFDVLNDSNLENVVLQTGKVNPDSFIKRHPEWKVIQFSLKFNELIAGAEVIVTHQGSTPLEAAAYKKPSIIVPDPDLKRTFPLRDSKIFAKKVGATVLSELTLENLVGAIEVAKKQQVPELEDGAKILAELILNLG